MDSNMHDEKNHGAHHDDAGGRRGRAPGRWAFWGFALAAGYFLLTEHRAHVLSFLPYLLLAACPLMHMLHHGGHGHDHHHGPQAHDPSRDPARDDGAPRRVDHP